MQQSSASHQYRYSYHYQRYYVPVKLYFSPLERIVKVFLTIIGLLAVGFAMFMQYNAYGTIFSEDLKAMFGLILRLIVYVGPVLLIEHFVVPEGYPTCGYCGYEYLNWSDHYCPQCGYLLDWREIADLRRKKLKM